ncbi:16S rRNA (uracil(1498)-N(3))-methyltransferase [Oleiharenicola sp. Vm1]|uniref:16S rRNA (uracil(1498)-N(3))-methyltransferase n=1 Tax=Oleiharenicola sp. Vm1 TaxID=3398393 RepID=UPI0039F5C9D3
MAPPRPRRRRAGLRHADPRGHHRAHTRRRRRAARARHRPRGARQLRGAARAARLPLPGDQPLVLALGPERGWGPRDRAQLRATGFAFAHLGARVLRLETAVIAALALAKSARGTL